MAYIKGHPPTHPGYGPLFLDPLPLLPEHREGIIFKAADHLSSQMTQVVHPLVAELGLRTIG